MGRRIYTRGQGRLIVALQAVPGLSRRNPGDCVGPNFGPPQRICNRPAPPAGFDPLRPDVQFQLLPGIGDLDPTVCDNGSQPDGGGVPGFPLAQWFAPGVAAITQAQQDVSCKMLDEGVTDPGSACTLTPQGLPGFLSKVPLPPHPNPTPTLVPGTRQYCFVVTAPAAFGDGDTQVGLAVRDNGGNLGPRQDFIIRVTP